MRRGARDEVNMEAVAVFGAEMRRGADVEHALGEDADAVGEVVGFFHGVGLGGLVSLSGTTSREGGHYSQQD